MPTTASSAQPTSHVTQGSSSTVTSIALTCAAPIGSRFANSGSVGSPFDADPRASYLLLDAGDAQVVRVEYDIEREVDLVLRSDYPDARRIAEMRRSGKFVRVTSPHDLGMACLSTSSIITRKESASGWP
jgi:hypothetical protein